MSWSYSGDPSSSTLDAVRFEIGDTDTTDQLMQDAEINFIYAAEGNIKAAAARCCKILWTKFAQQTDKFMGPLRLYYSQRAIAFKDLYKQLHAEAIGCSAPILDDSLDGVDEAIAHDPIFTVGMMDDKQSE